ncbi:hypothetical protein OEZ85_011064 [Tetradesmus obliquus]|uniref:Ricin B lectin domain-containing protein n=1 Tax=Tetradesmus obliquus TaxID=3088 RepID=A0ABY8TR84_TETOB|nr:hypothetical protein OEZ85_011064 [Tetradesmus obliquus]
MVSPKAIISISAVIIVVIVLVAWYMWARMHPAVAAAVQPVDLVKSTELVVATPLLAPDVAQGAPTQQPSADQTDTPIEAPLPLPPATPYLEWNTVAKQPVIGGLDTDGQELLICQAEHSGLTQPGYSVRGSATCDIGHWDQEVKSTAYRLLDTNMPHTWSTERGAARVKGGFAAGEDMFVCRGKIGGATYPGKAGGSAAHKTSVVQWDCADVDHMKWGLDDQGRMRPKHAPSMCLALEKAGEREVLSLNECDGSARQKWAATAPPPPNHKLLKSRLRSNLCLSVPSKDTNNGTELTTWDCANSPIDWPNYGFGMDAENRLVNKESGKCITVAGAGTHDGAAIVQQDCGRGPHFRWTHDDAGRLRPAHAPKMCMNISGGDPRNGGKIILYECTTDGATNELWDFV